MLTACDWGASTEASSIRVGFQDWILRLHPAIEQSVGPTYGAEHRVPATQRAGASASKLALDAREGRCDWDLYVGMTPFQEMANLVQAEAIVPWDEYMPANVVDDLHPAIREESTFEGRLYGWPFLLDVIVQGWNAELVERAGLDPTTPPATWDEYVEKARTLQKSGAAPYGCSFDVRGWRSLVPIAFTYDTDVYTEDGLFDYTHDAAAQALEVMRRMLEVANPDILDPSTTAGSGATTDEGAFASQLVGYYLKYTNALIRAANTWPDPSSLALSSIPAPIGGPGATLFWSTGLALTRHGGKKQEAAEYAEALTYDRRLWRGSIGTGRQSSGQIPCYRSLWAEWRTERPSWVPEWAVNTFLELRNGVAMRPHKLGNRQFTVAQPYLEQYLTGDETDARRVLRNALSAVRKEA